MANILSSKTTKELLVPSGDDQRFIEDSLNLINNNSRLKKLGRNSFDKAKNYSTEKIVDMYIDTFDKVNRI